jgi:hypothetical protein
VGTKATSPRTRPACGGGPTRRWLKVKQKGWTVEEDGWRRRLFEEDRMMQLARRTSLAVVLLLASVGTASAECA